MKNSFPLNIAVLFLVSGTLLWAIKVIYNDEGSQETLEMSVGRFKVVSEYYLVDGKSTKAMTLQDRITKNCYIYIDDGHSAVGFAEIPCPVELEAKR